MKIMWLSSILSFAFLIISTYSENTDNCDVKDLNWDAIRGKIDPYDVNVSMIIAKWEYTGNLAVMPEQKFTFINVYTDNNYLIIETIATLDEELDRQIPSTGKSLMMANIIKLICAGGPNPSSFVIHFRHPIPGYPTKLGTENYAKKEFQFVTIDTNNHPPVFQPMRLDYSLSQPLTRGYSLIDPIVVTDLDFSNRNITFKTDTSLLAVELVNRQDKSYEAQLHVPSLEVWFEGDVVITAYDDKQEHEASIVVSIKSALRQP